MITAHPGLPEFDYIRPNSLPEASLFLAANPHEAAPFMGGTDLFVRMRDGAITRKYLVDVKGLAGTSEIHYDPLDGLTIDAAVNMNRVVACREIQQCYPLLAEAARSVASYQLRTRATIVGNLCNASPAGDTTGACLVLQGMLHVHGIDGFRQEPLRGFFRGPGKTVLRPGDIVTSIWFPVPPAAQAACYLKLGRNTIGDLAIVGVTASGTPDPNLPSGYRFRIALTSVAPVPLVAVEAEEILANNPVNAGSIAEAARAAMQAATPIDDVRGSARYRKSMVNNLTRKALTEIWAQIAVAA
jgi:carbon-monoxide dehydrogenase medium subunit